MVMPPITDGKTLAASGAETEESRRPTVVSAPDAASPELVLRARRRAFSAKEKMRILDEADRAAGVPGAIGAIVRREGLYSSALTDWRRQRAAGAFEALSPVKRGPKVAEPNPLAAEHAQLQRDNQRLTKRLERAEAVRPASIEWRFPHRGVDASCAAIHLCDLDASYRNEAAPLDSLLYSAAEWEVSKWPDASRVLFAVAVSAARASPNQHEYLPRMVASHIKHIIH